MKGVKRMFKLFKLGDKKTKALAVFSLIFVALQGIFEGLQATMLASVLEVLNNTSSVDVQAYWIRTGLLLANAVMGFICGILGSWFGTKSSLLLAETIRHDMFYKASTLSFADIDRISTSSILTRITNDVQKYQMSMQLVLALFIRAPIMFAFGIVASFIKSWMFGLIFGVIMIIILLGFIIVSKTVIPAFDKVQTEIDNSNIVVRENVLGMKVIKSFCLEDQQAKRFDQYNKSLRKSNTKAWVGFGIVLPLVNCIIYTAISLIFIFAGQMLISGTGASSAITQAADVYELVNLLMITLSSVIISGMVIINCVRAMPSARRINEFLAIEPSIQNSKQPKVLDPKHLDIEFKHVDFKYFANAKNCVLNDINLKIKQGEMVGIVGPTGSGKTSLINLISRLYDMHDQKGSLTIGGIPVKEIDLNSLQDNVGVVLQERILFSGTIRENLKYGNQKASDAELLAAAKIACADSTIRHKKGGLSGVVEQRGRNFSGGQQQRLCIARTLLKKPNILILDDSTSALDMLTEARLQANIRQEMKGMTTIIVAQRISSVKDCDHIVVMEHGRIVGYGNHDSLRKSNQLYRSIVVSQMGKEGLTK